MAKRGRPRKQALREPNGRVKRPTLAQLKQAELSQRMAETDFVANQPHRRGARNPRDPRISTAHGRFCDRHRLREEIYQAAEQLAETYRRWRAAKGIPDPQHSSAMGSGGDGPSPSTVDGWWREIERVEAELRRYGSDAYVGVRHLLQDGQDVPDEASADTIVGLRVVAVQLGRLPAGAHPFASAVEKRRAA
jgi:hypothetical protein